MALRATSTVDDGRSRFDGKRMSEAEYLALPPEQPYLEYVDGVVVQKAMPNWDHSGLVHELDFLLGLLRRRSGGHVRVELRSLQLPQRDYRLADVSYFAPGAATGDDALPTLAIEVRSPNETVASQRRKCQSWIRAGCREAWLVEPHSRSIEVFGADGGSQAFGEGETLQSTAVPGLEVDVTALFAAAEQE
jgi:Uma2 family endonuclease